MDYIEHRLVTPPATEPLSVADAKRHLRFEVDPNDAENGGEHPDNAYLGDLIRAAREFFEDRTGRALATQQWLLVLDSFPRLKGQDPWWDGVRQGAMSMFDSYNYIELPKSPVARVDSITTYNYGNQAYLVPATVYNVSTTQRRITLNAGQAWPTGLRMNAAVEVLYTVGYGDDELLIPRAQRLMVNQLVAYWYENRLLPDQPLPKSLVDQLDTYKVRRL